MCGRFIDPNLRGSESLSARLQADAEAALDRFAPRITRLEMHLNDLNAAKSADDKRCQIEARPKGLQPLSVTHKAESIEFALDGAVEKLGHALDHQLGKLRSKRGPSHRDGVAAGDAGAQDQLLEEDFLAEQQLRSV